MPLTLSSIFQCPCADPKVRNCTLWKEKPAKFLPRSHAKIQYSIWHLFRFVVLEAALRLCLFQLAPVALAKHFNLLEKEAPCTLDSCSLNNRISFPSASSRWELTTSMLLLGGRHSPPLSHGCGQQSRAAPPSQQKKNQTPLPSLSPHVWHTVWSGNGFCTASDVSLVNKGTPVCLAGTFPKSSQGHLSWAY